MTATLSSLPIVDVYVAFNMTSVSLTSAYAQALPASGASNSFWTNISAYVKDFQKHSGVQHALDRMEAGTLSLTVRATDGFFWNSSVNGTGYILGPRLPIAVTVTWPLAGGTTYRKFFGMIDDASDSNRDPLNQDLTIEASDQLKLLSLRFSDTPAFWSGYIKSQSAVNYYSCAPTRTGIITNAVGSGSTITYTAFNDLHAGDIVTISGLGILSGVTLNLVNVTVVTANAYQFTLTSTKVGQSSGQGSVYRSRLVDGISANNALILGTASFPNNGAIIYVANACVDLANGSSAASALLQLPAYSATRGGIDFWLLGQGIANCVLMENAATSIGGVWTNVFLDCSPTGYPMVTVQGYGTTVSGPTRIDDGYWHHVGLVCNSSGVLQLYCDGVYTSLSAIAACSGMRTASSGVANLLIGNTSGQLGAPPMQVDEIVVSDQSSLSTLQNEVKNRYVAGTLLQLPTNPAAANVSSSDRIAQALTIAGYGHITAGVLTLNSNLFYVNDSGTPWASGAPGVNTQPYYWDAPIYESSILDIIYQICDTESGRFFQRDDGTFAFHTRAQYGTWNWNSTTNTGTWTPGTFTPSAGQSFDDVGTNVPYKVDTLQLSRDDSDLWTCVRVTPQSGVEQVYENTSAQAQYGYTTLVKGGTVHNSLNDALSTANYLGYLYRRPLPRVQAMEVSSAFSNGSYNTSVVAIKLGQVVNFIRTPLNAAGSGIINQQMVVLAHDLAYSKEAGELVATYLLDPYLVAA